MAVKIPSLFKKPLPAAQFEKRITRYIEQPADQEFLRSCFTLKTEGGAGFYVLKKEIDAKGAARLAALAKAIKANRVWPVKALPLAVCAIAVTGAVFFFTVLMNPLLERALESGLESAFEARADVDRFRLNLLRFRVSIAAVTVANKEHPMENLFELSRVEFRLLPQAVLRGKIYIEEIRADGLKFGTPRKTSGALARFAADSAAAQKKAAKASEPPLVNLADFDAKALLDRERDKMRSFAAYDEAISLYTTTEAQWKERVDSARTRTAELQNAAKPFMELNLNNMDIRNPETLQRLLKLIDDAKKAREAVQNATNEASSIVDGVNTSVKSALDLKKSAENAVKDDLARLKSYIDVGNGGYHQILDPILEEVLSTQAQNYLDYGKTALSALNKIKSLQAALPKKEKKPREAAFKGRDVPFPTPRYPFFYLGILATDVTVEGWKNSFDLRNVSSEPELIDAPVTLALRLNEEGGARRTARFDGTAELRSSKPELFDARVEAENFPVRLDAGIEPLGLSGFSGSAAVTVNAAGAKTGDWNTRAGISVHEPRIDRAEGIVAGAIDEAVREAGIVTIAARFEHSGGSNAVDLETNIGELIMNALKKTAQAYIGKAVALLEAELKTRLTPYLEKVNLGQAEFDALARAARGDKSALDSLSRTLNDKIAGMEQKAKSAAEGKANAAVDSAKDKAASAASSTINNIFRR